MLYNNNVRLNNILKTLKILGTDSLGEPSGVLLTES